MKLLTFGRLSSFLFLFIIIATTVLAQEESKAFALPDAHAGEAYRVEL